MGFKCAGFESCHGYISMRALGTPYRILRDSAGHYAAGRYIETLHRLLHVIYTIEDSYIIPSLHAVTVTLLTR